jgi:cytochrome P450
LLQKVIEMTVENGGGATDYVEPALDECLLILMAALDTTAWAISTSIYNILTHPEVLQRVLAEVDAVPEGDMAAMCNLPYVVRPFQLSMILHR